MGKIAKRQRRAVRNGLREARLALATRTPAGLRRRLGPLASWLDMLVMDHGIFRLAYSNTHKITPDAWRSAQPAPHNIRAFARAGGRTVVNLRGMRVCGGQWLEEAACRKAGLELVTYQLRSRAAPSRAELHGVRDLLRRIEYPVLFHCKSGADRAGLMSVLFCHLHAGQPIEQARRQLSLRYGHIAQAETGIIDRFFDSYIAYNRATPTPFFTWVDEVYDPQAMEAAFKTRGWANAIVNRVLRRE
ncbi:MAG: sulfur transferase domain-containing protein [Pseudomonadota bacterium]